MVIIEIGFMTNGREISSNRRSRVVLLLLWLVVVVVMVLSEMKRRRFLLNFKWIKRQTSSLATFHSGIPVILNFVVSSSG